MIKTYPFPAESGIEPPLADLLADPTLKSLLDRDGLSVDDVRACVADWRNRHLLAPRLVPAAA
ncbi:MAG: hypothetical protein JJ900_15190 [Rhodospirillales bacterium]|nr:hypothetical protein [Rhodospirillales bacterium]MBO6788192.1 hypothetical protein [Rhodospirillales bacterium]